MLLPYNFNIMSNERDIPNEESTASSSNGTTRRGFLARVAFAGAGLTLAPLLSGAEQILPEVPPENAGIAAVSLTINGQKRNLNIDPRTTLLDLLRENLQMPGTKKGCDHGQCGACTVLVNGRRINSCLTFAVMCQDAKVTTVEGLAQGDNLHPIQAAFVKHDAFQCGYCTPGQICSAVGLVNEGHAKSDKDIRELMSGNICRCGAYQNIVEAVKEVINV
ncbi:MAG: xanthine dehydrogenase YagT iron-sulfur-binding subunit [Mucilaginibacter sp.]|nr:xanthine dehydrogenase YagT iron-sulfur-binding subunit [Mucilaginibacter sp.]